MTALTATVAAASVVLPLVVQGDQFGKLHEAGCTQDKEVRSVMAALPQAGRGPTSTRPIVIDTGNLLAPDPDTRYAVTQGGPGLTALANALLDPGGRPIFDAMVPGRHDLSLRRDRLRVLSEQARLPWVVANLEPRIPYQRYRVVQRDGIRVGITAVIDDRMLSSFPPAVKREKLTDSRAALEEAVTAMRGEGVDLVVAVSYQQTDGAFNALLRLLERAKAKPDVLILSPVAGDVLQVNLGARAPVVLAAPGGFGRAVVAHVEVRRGARWRFLGARRVELQPRRDDTLAEVRREVCEALARPIGPPDRNEKITQEAFTRFVLELIRRQTGAEVAVISQSTVRDAFPLDVPLTPLDLMRVIPLDDGIQVADVSGSAMAPLFRLETDARARVSGISGQRVAGRALDRGRTYRVAAVDFVAEGGDAIFKPGELEWEEEQGVGELREMIRSYLRKNGFDPDADPDPDDEVEEPALLSAQVNLGGNLKTVTVSNSRNLEAPQLSRDQFFSATALVDLRIIADLTRHRFQLYERTRFGVAREGTGSFEENDDVTTVEFTYIGRFASKTNPWYIPNASATVSLETELTVPDEEESDRNYRRALLQAGVGPSFALLSNVSIRVQLGLRRELLASPSSDNEAERRLAETRMALISNLEILKYTFATDYGRPVAATLRLDHALDLTGTVRDNILQGRLDFDIPVAPRLSITMGLELYFLDRAVDEGSNPGSGLAFDTSLGISTFGDLSTVLF